MIKESFKKAEIKREEKREREKKSDWLAAKEKKLDKGLGLDKTTSKDWL